MGYKRVVQRQFANVLHKNRELWKYTSPRQGSAEAQQHRGSADHAAWYDGRAIDPVYHLLPEDQIKRVSAYDQCDIDPEFMGFTNIYFALASIIPKHWTVVDLGCAFAPQAFMFKDHAGYVGVDRWCPCEARFAAPNTTHYEMSIAGFCAEYAASFPQQTTFAICSYVPDWLGDNREIARRHFTNVFTYYPAGEELVQPAPWK